ncbi:unnamed protein product [Phytophthora fragariaefolia]|uniref:Unnamed protein product n=1 Tax=Phytophthora fragariaefolia TaxID=1490495 RepID=A0A9W7CUW0_9STRA|nr:unnamed protein product [Phytophthora fragariaefolia]
MADALEGGKTQRANARCALVAFVRNAYPKHTDFLETKTDLECQDPERELQAGVEVLSRKAGSDGRLPDRTKNKAKSQATSTEAKTKTKAKTRTPSPRLKSQKKPETGKKRAAEANAAVVERKKKPKNPGTFAGKSGIGCFECGGDGHTAAFHRKYLRIKPADEGSKEASAQLADADNSEEDEEVETAGADVDDDENEDDE